MEKQVEAIWHEFSARLHGYILQRVRDPQAADDILQDVFLRVHRGLPTLRQQDRLAAWLFQITRRAISDHYRQLKLTHELSPDLVEPEPDDDHAIERELATSLRGMIASLPAEYRTPLLLDTANVPQAEIAARLGLSHSAAKSRVQRARAKLRDLLLACCHFEFDRRGQVIDYYPHAACCASCACSPAATPS